MVKSLITVLMLSAFANSAWAQSQYDSTLPSDPKLMKLNDITKTVAKSNFDIDEIKDGVYMDVDIFYVGCNDDYKREVGVRCLITFDVRSLANDKPDPRLFDRQDFSAFSRIFRDQISVPANEAVARIFLLPDGPYAAPELNDLVIVIKEKRVVEVRSVSLNLISSEKERDFVAPSRRRR